MISSTWSGLMFLAAIGGPASSLGLLEASTTSARTMLPCECTATFTGSNGTYLCPDGKVGIQVICQDPALQSGPCESPVPCHPTTNSKCVATFGDDDLNVVLSNCKSDGVWLTVSGYNGGARVFYKGVPAGFDLPVTEVACQSGASGESTATVEVKCYPDEQPSSSPFFTWTGTLHCKKCDAQ